MAVELKIIDASGNYSEILPDWSDLTFSQDLVAPGSLTFSYPSVGGRNVDFLTGATSGGVTRGHGLQMAVLLDGVEPINGRFTYMEGTGSRIVEADGSTATYSCQSNLGRYSSLMLAPAVGSTTADENMFAFTNRTPGYLVRNAIVNAMSRYGAHTGPAAWFTSPVTAFSDTLDTSGFAWPATYDVKFDPGSKVADVIQWLSDYGVAEAYMDKKLLKLFDPPHNGRNLAAGGSPTVLQTGRDFTQASYQTSSLELVNALLVLGDANSCTWVFDEASIAAYGYRESTLTVSNASTQPTLTAVGNAYLSTRSVPRWAYTYAVSALYLDKSTGVARPFVDYQVGDSILILDGVSTAVRRLRLLSATWPNSTAASVNLSVNDWFSERDVEFDRRLRRLGA